MSFIASWSACGLKIRPVSPTRLVPTIDWEIRDLVPNSLGKSKIDVSNEKATCMEPFSEVTRPLNKAWKFLDSISERIKTGSFWMNINTSEVHKLCTCRFRLPCRGFHLSNSIFSTSLFDKETTVGIQLLISQNPLEQRKRTWLFSLYTVGDSTTQLYGVYIRPLQWSPLNNRHTGM